MKTKLILGLTMLTGVAAIAQENDDLYFRSKDREKLEAVRATEQTYVSNYDNFKKKHFNEPTELDEYTNPTDSYSARNVNPEYISRSYSDQVSEDEANYFVEGYAPATNNFNYNSGYYYNGFNNNVGWNSWYGPQFYNTWGSPYGWNDPWMNAGWGGNRWMNPYWGNRWGSGWSLSASYFWGNSWGNSWGNNWGWGWNDPFWNPYNSWGSSWSYWNNGWYRPTTVVVVGGDGNRPNYGKRPTRSSAGVGEVSNAYVRPSRSNSNVDSGNGDTGGRNKTSNDYYVRPSRRTTTNTSGYTNSNSSSNWNNSNSTIRQSRSSTFNNSGYSPSRSSGNNNNSGYSPSRSSGNSNSYSPSRSSGSSGGNTPSRSSGSSGSSGSSSRPSRGGN
jgi:hypothetical protein